PDPRRSRIRSLRGILVPPGQRQRKEEKTVSGPSPGQRFPQGRRVSSRSETRNGQPSPAGGRRFAQAQTDPPKRLFLVDRARPVLFVARPKREWGAHCFGQRRFPPPERAHCRQQPGTPYPMITPTIKSIMVSARK